MNRWEYTFWNTVGTLVGTQEETAAYLNKAVCDNDKLAWQTRSHKHALMHKGILLLWAITMSWNCWQQLNMLSYRSAQNLSRPMTFYEAQTKEKPNQDRDPVSNQSSATYDRGTEITLWIAGRTLLVHSKGVVAKRNRSLSIQSDECAIRTRLAHSKS